MDPISIILAAIIAGASAGAGEVAKEEIKAAYGALKSRIRGLFGKDSPVEAAVGMVEENPSGEKVKEHLRQTLSGVQADQDEELVALADTLLKAAHTTAENVLRVGEYAEVTDSAQSIQADRETSGQLRNEMEVGKGAKVSGSGQSITIGPPTGGERD